MRLRHPAAGYAAAGDRCLGTGYRPRATYQLPGIQYALRFIADGEYLDRRIVATANLEQVGNLVNYLVGDPVQQTHDDFMDLGPRLAEMGRFPEVRPTWASRKIYRPGLCWPGRSGCERCGP